MKPFIFHVKSLSPCHKGHERAQPELGVRTMWWGTLRTEPCSKGLAKDMGCNVQTQGTLASGWQVHLTTLSSLIKLNHHVYLSLESHWPHLPIAASLGPPRTGQAFLPTLCSNSSISLHPFSLLCNSTSKSHLGLRVSMLCYLCSGHTGFHTDDSMLPQTPELL